MSSTFSRTTRSLATDGTRRRSGKLLIAAVLIGVWTAWFLGGRVAVHDVTEIARFEVSNVARPVVSLVPGQVTNTDLMLGRTVKAGELLVQLDDRAERLALEEGRARLRDLRAQVKAIDAEIDAEEAAAAAYVKSGPIALAEYGARTAEAEARASHAEQNAARVKRLFDKNVTTEAEFLAAKSDALAIRAGVQALQLARSRLEQNQRVNQRDRETRSAKLRRERAELTGPLATQQATLLRLQRDVELRQVRAPVSGRIGQVRDFPVGSAVAGREVLGYVIPPARPRAVAYFPVAAAGRIRPGQLARLRLEGFPWVQYGSIPATVTNVASEAEQRRLRVELRVHTHRPLPIPVEHGLSGSAHVLVERVSPAVLVLRATGWFLRR